MKRPHLPLIPQGLSREGWSSGRGAGREVTDGGRGAVCSQASTTSSCPGFPQTTLAVLFVTYCGVQLVKERERALALEEEQKEDKLKPE